MSDVQGTEALDHASVPLVEDSPARVAGNSALVDFIAELRPTREAQWAWDHYKDTVIAAIRHFGCHALMEVGGGRAPLLDDREIASLDVGYTVNDISEAELRRAPDYVGKELFDIAGKVEASGRYDLIVSRMVMEHASDSRQAYRNIHGLLRKGGLVISFYPTLYAPPFVINRLFPEILTRQVLRFFFPDRSEEDTPKFPARYSWCYATGKVERMLRETGFSDIVILPFYGYIYFSKIPIIRDIDRTFTDWVRRHDFRPMAAFAYILARK